ncbi:MAG: response regulator transcription factor [Dehalococcoidia bacterium]
MEDRDGRSIRVVIADDSKAILSGLAAFLRNSPGIEVIGLANDGIEAVAMASELKPDVVVLDVQMPGQNGIEAARIIKRDMPGVGIVVFSISRNYMVPSLEAGADEFLQKDCDPKELVSTLKRIAA